MLFVVAPIHVGYEGENLANISSRGSQYQRGFKSSCRLTLVPRLLVLNSITKSTDGGPLKQNIYQFLMYQIKKREDAHKGCSARCRQSI